MDMKPIINTLTNFLSSKLNLTILQCILYFVLGYMLREHYSWGQFGVIFTVLLAIQFITHIKGVSQGMVMFQMMEEDRHHFMKYIKKLKEESEDNGSDLPN